jgi:hypothetical protein
VRFASASDNVTSDGKEVRAGKGYSGTLLALLTDNCWNIAIALIDWAEFSATRERSR